MKAKLDKFKKSGLTPVPAELVEPPLIKECAGHLECRVTDVFPMQAHDLLICHVIRALADSELFNGRWITEKFHTLHYLNSTSYGIMGKTIEVEHKKINEK